MTEYNLHDLNWLAIIVGAIIPMVLGFIWYHPKLFGRMWMDSLGFNEEDLKGGNMAMIFGLSFLLAAVLAYTISLFMAYHPEDYQTFGHGLLHGGMVAVTLAIPVLVTNSLFERKSWTNIFVNGRRYWSSGLIRGNKS